MVRSGTRPAAAADTWWLPRGVVALRVRIFEKVNGDHTVTLPNATHGPEVFERVYAHPAVDGRSAGAGLSDLFWYWLAPGPEVHQEHLEPGERYEDVAAATRRMLVGGSADLAEAATRAFARVLDTVPDTRVSLVRLRDLVMPAWAEFCYELVFKEPCPPRVRDLITGHAEDVISALKCTGLRHPRRRARLTAYLRDRVAAGDVPHALPASLSPAEQVHYLQGTMFNTAVVQLSEATAHVLLALARHPDVQRRAAEDSGDDDRYLAHVLDETMRLYPLFGIAHRITTGEVPLDEDTVLPAGSVVCFSYPGYHATGYDRPDAFDPDRWAALSAKDAHHIPFGMAANRPCPAWRLSPLVMRAAVREVLRRFRLDSTASHTRSIPHRAPCLLVPRGLPVRPRRLEALRSFVRVRDGVEDVTRGVRQLVLGTAMVLHARHQRLATRYFAGQPAGGCPVAHPGDAQAGGAPTEHEPAAGPPPPRPEREQPPAHCPASAHPTERRRD
ncbi:cytochrome P450 [Streptomyces olivaceus]|uniref:Cytochrome P450 n=1 Tax=Streptomyces olivaceus TaxID=47716 RepID=A0ABS7VZV6_STROV|nr:cytochrome P450 [Streptomyces olivaceus]MBZ6095398.1 cytochrome P450 [Streptomyces olivaceus]MBZ6109449.1 cytochrome P450 [Streptomyces olivaceus]MBZ6115904.1 cytochrome P450 [Streptomyces olivaceus]MBZ6123624.1 cytochrome P450 [Streptomyces olivaceus]